MHWSKSSLSVLSVRGTEDGSPLIKQSRHIRETAANSKEDEINFLEKDE